MKSIKLFFVVQLCEPALWCELKGLVLLLLFLPLGQRQIFSQSIACGGEYSLKLCSGSIVQAAGWNFDGQLGNGTNTGSNVPVQVSSLIGVTALAGGGRHSLALKNDGTVWAWGYNFFGQLGNGNNVNKNIPVQVSFLTGIIAIRGGSTHSLALKNDSTVWAWGDNFSGQLGNGTNGFAYGSNFPVLVGAPLIGVTALAGGKSHSLALKNDGTVWSWGDNFSGQLGNGNNAFSNVPVSVSSLTGITYLECGYYHSLALKNDSTVWSWGGNGNGELGNGTNTASNVPVPVSFLTGVIAIAGGAYHSLALKNDSTVWAWGLNGKGQLGNGTNTDSNIPYKISSLTGITALECGDLYSLALKNDGTVWAWGDNSKGQLGNGTNTDSNVPVLMGGCTVSALPADIAYLPGELLLFPNPCNGKFTLIIATRSEAKGKQSQTMPTGRQVEIYNVLGEKIHQSLVNGHSSLAVDISSEPSGVYFLNLKTEKEFYTQKLIISP